MTKLSDVARQLREDPMFGALEGDDAVDYAAAVLGPGCDPLDAYLAVEMAQKSTAPTRDGITLLARIRDAGGFTDRDFCAALSVPVEKRSRVQAWISGRNSFTPDKAQRQALKGLIENRAAVLQALAKEV